MDLEWFIEGRRVLMLAYLWNYCRDVIRLVKVSPNQSASFELVRVGCLPFSKGPFQRLIVERHIKESVK